MAEKKESTAVPNSKNKSFICGPKDLEYLWQVGPSTIRNYCQAGMPKITHGTYDVKACLDWWLDNIYKAKNEAADDSMTEHKRRYWKEKADEIAMSNENKRAGLIKRDDLEAGVVQLIANMRSALLNMPERIYANDDAGRAALREEIHIFLRAVSEDRLIADVAPADGGKPKSKAKKPGPKKRKKVKQ